MAYDKIFARSFSRYEQKKLGCGALVGCLLVALSICTVFKPYLVPLQVLNLRLSMGAGLKMLMITDTSHSKPIENKGHTTTEDFNSSVIAYIHGGEGEKFTMNENKGHTTTTDFNSSVIAYVHGEEKITINETVTTKMEPVCNFTGSRSDFCEANGDIRIQGGISSTIYIASPQTMGILAGNSTSWEIRPYARKTDATAMSFVRKWSVIKSVTSHQTDTIPGCTVNHKIPAILFSVGGYSGNHFHAFTDVVIPLFLTSRPFNGEVQFLLTDQRSWWINKFRILLKKLSNYEVIDIDKDDQIHCFPSIIVGLKSHKELNIDPSKPPYYSMDDFRVFLRSVYSLNRTTAIKLRVGHKGKKARLLLISRKKTRSFTNEKKIAKMARRSGFQVVVAEADTRTSLMEFAQVVNSCDAVMGVHGAGLTNIVFLPDNAVFIQIVPLGKMESLSRYDFGDPAKDMKLRYLEYSIKESESSLIQQYPRDHAVFKDPYSLQAQGWLPFKSVYLDKQNIKLDVKRFRPILSKALELLHDDQKPL